MLILGNLELIFDIIVAVLLAATIAYAVILNRKLDALRSAKAEMQELINSFSQTTIKAEKGLADLKAHASQTGSGLQEQVGKADRLLQDLSYLVDRAESVADRLEDDLGLVRKKAPEAIAPRGVEPGGGKADLGVRARPEASGAADLAGGKPGKPAGKAKELSPAAADLLKALKGMR